MYVENWINFQTFIIFFLNKLEWNLNHLTNLVNDHHLCLHYSLQNNRQSIQYSYVWQTFVDVYLKSMFSKYFSWIISYNTIMSMHVCVLFFLLEIEIGLIYTDLLTLLDTPTFAVVLVNNLLTVCWFLFIIYELTKCFGKKAWMYKIINY